MPRKHPITLTDVITGYKERLSQDEIAERHGCSVAAVSRRITAVGLKDHEIRRWVRDGKSIEEMLLAFTPEAVAPDCLAKGESQRTVTLLPDAPFPAPYRCPRWVVVPSLVILFGYVMFCAFLLGKESICWDESVTVKPAYCHPKKPEESTLDGLDLSPLLAPRKG